MADPDSSDPQDASDVSSLIADICGAETPVTESCATAVYDELRRMAHRQLRGERDDHILRTTELVHEAYMKLSDSKEPDWKDRSHFFAVAARAMRQVLVDYARRRTAEKRGGEAPSVPLSDVKLPELPADRPDQILEIDDALDRLGEKDERMARVVECRFFVGYTLQETADALGVSRSTVVRDWRAARAWLKRELAGSS